jgi:hypothetical protein
LVSSLESCRSRIRSSKRHFAISRFESRHPSQPQRSLAADSPHSAKKRHFRRLAARSLVSGEEFRAPCAEGRESGGESLLDDFSISEIWVGRRPETGCVSAETGSNVAPARNRGLFRSRSGGLQWRGASRPPGQERDAEHTVPYRSRSASQNVRANADVARMSPTYLSRSNW